MIRVLLFAVTVLSGCSLPFSVGGSPKTVYRLEVEAISPGSVRVNEKLAVRDILSSGYTDSHRVLFTRSSGQIGSYQFATWEEFPAKRLTDLLLVHLQSSGSFACVTRTTSGAVSDLQLNGLLLEFIHDVEARSIRSTLQLEIVDLSTRSVRGQHIFRLVEPVTENNVDGAVEGYHKIARRLIEEISNWLVAELGTTEGERSKEPSKDSGQHQGEESGKHQE